MSARDIDLQMMKIALRDYPGNGKPEPNDAGTILLRQYGLIEEKVQNKRCKTCGAERPDYHWFKITPAGRLFMQLAGIGPRNVEVSAPPMPETEMLHGE